jgi:non-specific protein-tyrosine kinase
LHGIGVDSPVKVSTVKQAIPASGPSSPKKSINFALGLLLGFGAGIGIASLRKILDNTVKNEDDLDGTPLLAAIGFDNMADEKPLITQAGRYAARTESFRTLRTNLQFLSPDDHPQVIAFTSALRRPKIPIYLEMSTMEPGLTELISGQKILNAANLKSLLKTESKSGLKVLLSGKVPPNPSELLGSHKFHQLIDLLRKQFEYVIIDCPPLLPVTDAAVVATKADGALVLQSVHTLLALEMQLCPWDHKFLELC